MVMVKKLLIALGIGVCLLLPNFSFALTNTYSIDLESGSVQYLSGTKTNNGNEYTTITLQVWIKPESLPTAGNIMDVLHEYSTDAKYDLYLENSGGTQRICFYLEPVTTSHTTICENYTTSTTDWTHLMASFSGNGGNAKLYINGTLVETSGTLIGGFADGSNHFAIGYDNSNTRWPYDGLIDEVRIWQEVLDDTDYNDSTRGVLCNLTGTETNLIQYWNLNYLITSSTSNPVNLTNNNSATFSSSVPFSTDTCGSSQNNNYWVNYQIMSTTTDLILGNVLEWSFMLLVLGVFLFFGTVFFKITKK